MAASGKLTESYEQLAKMSAVVTCGLGEQASKLADEYVRIIEQSASAVVVSQTWGEVHRVNSQVREALKAKGLLGAADAAVQILDRLDLTNAQKRDERFYPPDAVIVFNQKAVSYTHLFRRQEVLKIIASRLPHTANLFGRLVIDETI